jgi:hypothetical protein
MALYLVSFSGQLTSHASAAREELKKWGGTKLWDDVWVVDMASSPQASLPGFVQTEAAVSIPLEGTDAFFSVGRAAGLEVQMVFFEKVFPLLRRAGNCGEAIAQVRYGNGGEAVFKDVVRRYIWARQNSSWATELCHLMARNGSDKAIGWHTYTPFYQELFLECRNRVAALFELGLGTNNEDTPSNMGAHGNPGASLRGWRDYFPTARIYGADIDKRVLFVDERIDTFFVDQCNPNTFDDLWANIPDVELDIFLDDGLHTIEAAKTTFAQSIGKLKIGGYYIIEDVMNGDLATYVSIFDELRLPCLSINICHPSNVYDNCLVVALKV